MRSGRIPLIVDCDNTMGLARQEIDDGLVILFLLACPSFDLIGITTTFGNGPEPQVYRSTLRLLEAIDRRDIPVIRGAGRPGQWSTPASEFISDEADRHRSDLAVLSIGALTNLAGALAGHSSGAQHIGQVAVMGGYEAPLRFPRRTVDELNLSADPEAAFIVLHSRLAVTLMSAQICLTARYGLRHLAGEHLRAPLLAPLVRQWFAAFGSAVGVPGFYLWDLVPAWYLHDPERFRSRIVRLLSSERDLAMGTLLYEELPAAAGPATTQARAVDPSVLNLPDAIRFPAAFAGDCARIWRRTKLKQRLPVESAPYPV